MIKSYMTSLLHDIGAVELDGRGRRYLLIVEIAQVCATSLCLCSVWSDIVLQHRRSGLQSEHLSKCVRKDGKRSEQRTQLVRHAKVYLGKCVPKCLFRDGDRALRPKDFSDV
jgi:hypothetical protein